MASRLAREFQALCAIAQRFGRPGTLTDQAWIESLNGHIKIEHPHQLAITDPATLRAELAVVCEHYNTDLADALRRTGLLLAPDLEADLGDAEQYLLT